MSCEISISYSGRTFRYISIWLVSPLPCHKKHSSALRDCRQSLQNRSYPGRGTLTIWVREAFPEARRGAVGSVGQRGYPESFKQAPFDALDQADREGSIGSACYRFSIARDLGFGVTGPL